MNQGIRSDRRISPCRPLPEGEQSGEQFVREHFIDSFKSHARSQENVLLVVSQDVDKVDMSPGDLRRNYCMLIQEAGLNILDVDDKLLFVFPKRNIETWFEWIQQDIPRGKIDEEKDFKMRHRKPQSGKLGKDASILYTKSLADPSICENAPDSLLFSCEEFKALCERL